MRAHLFLLAAALHAASAQRPAAPDGVYFGTELRSQLNFATNGYEYRTIAYTFVFAPDGRVARGVTDLAAAAPTSTGVYTMRGDTMDIAWRDGTIASFAYDRGRGTLSRGRARLSHVVSPPDYRLDGTYGTERFTNLSSGAGLPTTGVGGWNQITFRPDGRFATESATGVTTASANGAGTASTRTAGGGTYRVHDFALDLTFANGERRTLPFWVDAGEARSAAPQWIVVSGAVWLRRS
jgi:hypothetical protein